MPVTKKKMIEHYETQLGKMFSDGDFKRYFGDDKVIKYSDLSNYSTINELLPLEKDFRVILVESKYNEGHWVALLKYGDIIEWWNSYGTKPEYDFKFIPTPVRIIIEKK